QGAEGPEAAHIDGTACELPLAGAGPGRPGGGLRSRFRETPARFRSRHDARTPESRLQGVAVPRRHGPGQPDPDRRQSEARTLCPAQRPDRRFHFLRRGQVKSMPGAAGEPALATEAVEEDVSLV